MASRRWGLETWKFAIYLAGTFMLLRALACSYPRSYTILHILRTVPIAVSCYLTKPEMLIKVIKQVFFIFFPRCDRTHTPTHTPTLSASIECIPT